VFLNRFREHHVEHNRVEQTLELLFREKVVQVLLFLHFFKGTHFTEFLNHHVEHLVVQTHGGPDLFHEFLLVEAGMLEILERFGALYLLQRDKVPGPGPIEVFQPLPDIYVLITLLFVFLTKSPPLGLNLGLLGGGSLPELRHPPLNPKIFHHSFLQNLHYEPICFA